MGLLNTILDANQSVYDRLGGIERSGAERHGSPTSPGRRNEQECPRCGTLRDKMGGCSTPRQYYCPECDETTSR